jgi:hypothetical protein
MGGEGERVNIWQWKATWDKEGAGTAGNEMMQDLEDQYNYMAMGSGSYYIYEPDGKLVLAPKQSLKVSERHTYIDPGMGKNEGVFNPGRATGNILSDNTLRRSPVEDLNAEGFSTLTTQSHQDVYGSGNWGNSRWMVVFKRRLAIVGGWLFSSGASRREIRTILNLRARKSPSPSPYGMVTTRKETVRRPSPSSIF